MPRCPSNLISRIRALVPQEWQDHAPLRWAAQLTAGALPGVVMCVVIMKLATEPADPGSGAHVASIVPLLSASAVVDTAAFHRLRFANDPAADSSVRFRSPDDNAPVHAAKAVVRAGSLPVNFNAPRTSWKHLQQATRETIDTGLLNGKGRPQIVLHGSKTSHGNARLLDRYQTAVRGGSAGMAYHFVIGNGNGSGDGLIEACERWAKTLADDDASIQVCLVGDFSTNSPSSAQLEALDELMDYLTIKLGAVSLTAHCARLPSK